MKRLTGSDLTLFEWQFRNINKGNQKSINLNANVFIEKLYPLLPQLADEKGGRLPLDLSIYGPGLHGLDNLQRKIIKGGTYKNWRLNGEFIYNRPETPDRYNILEEGDFGFFEFYGIEYPTAAKLLLISKKAQPDLDLFDELNRVSEGKSMVDMESNALQEIVESVNPSSNHPVYEFVLENVLEEIVLTGGDVDQETIISKPSLRNINVADFQKAKKAAETNGRRGEEFVNEYLEAQKIQGNIKDFNWQSNINPISPFDFSYVSADETEIYLDVKSTNGPFENKIHISFNELVQMSGSIQYDIYRVYLIAENAASLRVATNLTGWAKEIIAILNNLPDGVRAAGVSLKPEVLNFSQEIALSIEDQD